jgi:prevent-host-death family protein
MDVGVRELKRRLSELLDLAERGELVRVTDRGRPKAMLGPINRGSLCRCRSAASESG